MIRGALLEKLATAALTAVAAILVSSLGAYVAISKAQTAHELRIQTLEKNDDSSEGRIRQDLREMKAEIKAELKEVREAQARAMERMIDRK